MKKILFVDDESGILNSVKRTMRGEPYEVLTADSGAAGLELLREHDVGVIISDMRMPGMDGAQFLTASRNLRPDATRIMLSGFAEKDSILKAINDGKIWSFLVKPWENEVLKVAIQNAFDIHEHVVERKRLIAELEDKNNQLAGMNAVLEQKVSERTQELNARTEILQMMLDSEDYDEVLKRIRHDLGMLTGAGKVEIRPAGPEVDMPQSRPIKKGTKVIGHLRIEPFPAGTEKVQVIERFVPLVAFALAMREISKGAPQMIRDIDHILQDMQ